MRRSLALLWSQPLTNKERQQCQQLLTIVFGDDNTDKPSQLVLSHRKQEFSGVSRFVRSCQHLDSVSEGSPGVVSGWEQHCPRHQSTRERAVSILPSPFHSMLATLKFCLQQKRNPKEAANPNSNHQHPRSQGTISPKATALCTSPRQGISSSVLSSMLQHVAVATHRQAPSYDQLFLPTASFTPTSILSPGRLSATALPGLVTSDRPDPLQ